MFRNLYNKVLLWAAMPNAEKILMCVSFIESAFFPIPPDVMLAPMTMAKPDKAWRYALLTTLCSVLGGIFGYCLGYFAYYTAVIPLFQFLGKEQAYIYALSWFQAWGVWVVLVAAFTPLPYKLFTIGAGVLQMNLPVFILVSIFGRGARFFMVCGLFKLGNKYLADFVQRWIDVIGWTVLILLVFLYYFLVY